MSANTLEKATKRQNVVDSRGIKFSRYIDPDQWPPTHQKTFETITTLGSTNFKSWCKKVSIDWEKSPWTLDTKQRAKDIFETAKHCNDEDVVERVWRSRLEPFIFHSMDRDFFCRRCGNRLRRSHIEAVAHPEEEFASRLSQAQENRTVCPCEHTGPKRREEGLSLFFDYREGNRAPLDQRAKSDIHQPYEIPDKVYALRSVGTLHWLLRQKDTREGSAEKTLMQTLSPSLFQKNPNPLVFPFLLCESKSFRSSGSFQDIDRQMGLMIEQCLLIQDRLRKATGSRSRWVAGPMVWCFSHKGPLWVLSAACFRDDKKNINIEISKLWEANITTKDGAIQLLLIVDYICDWARSIHREAIIRELRKLAPPVSDNISELPTIEQLTVRTYHDYRSQDGELQAQQSSQQTWSPVRSNIRNPPHEVQQRIEHVATWQAAQEDSNLNTVIENDPFRQYDSLYGAIRDATYVQSKVLQLYITDSTFDSLLNCRPSDEQSIWLLNKIKRSFEIEESVLVEQSTLYDLEANWSGHRRDFRNQYNPQEELRVIFTVSAYIDSEWNLVRELCYVAISQSAMKRLHEKLSVTADTKQMGDIIDSEWAELKSQRSSKIAKLFASYLKASPIQTFAGCLYRSSLQPIFKYKKNSDISIRWKKGKFICRMDNAPQGRSRYVAWFLYRSHKIGRNEPSTPFLQTSQRVQSLELLQGDDERLNPWTTSSLPSSEEAIPTYSTNKFGKVVPETARCCIYILNRKRFDGIIEELASGRVFSHCVLIQRLSPKSGRPITWNVENQWNAGRVMKKVSRLVDYVASMMFRDDSDEESDTEAEDGSDEYRSSEDGSSENGSSENGSSEDGSHEDESGEYESEEDGSNGDVTDETEGEDSVE